ncbi:MAG: ABC transporter ATP-binding protein [Planctomycetes bacterium]|nr:ABC transporter ATP-binding protein [Planctomycetota bacterium]
MTAGDEAAAVISLRGLCKSYEEGGRRRTILEEVDLDVAPGELVALLGRSGSGKSTLLNLVGGMDRPDRGSIVAAGRDLVRLDEAALATYRRERVGFVFQFFNLIPTLTVLENVRLKAELVGLPVAEQNERARALLAEVGLEDREGAWPDRLSGGEQQRVAIAAALVHDPEIVLADEPTGNLDLDTGRRVMELLDRLCRARGKCLLLATHSAEVMGVADRVLGIEHGRLVPREAEP